MNRRKLMMITQSSLFFVSGSLALLTLAGHVTPLKTLRCHGVSWRCLARWKFRRANRL